MSGKYLVEDVASPGMDGVIDARDECVDEERFWSPVPSTSAAGVYVTPYSALRHGPVWQAINILAGDVGQLPLSKMIRRGRDSEIDRRHWSARLFHDRPNSWQTPQEWKEYVMMSVLLWGNSVSVVTNWGTNRAELIPLPPESTYYQEFAQGQFMITSTVNGRYIEVTPADTFHIRALAVDQTGFWGLSPIQVGSPTVAHGVALQRHGNAMFANGAFPGGVLEHPGRLSDTATENLRQQWERMHRGPDRSGRAAILQEGMTFKAATMTNTDAQWLESRKADREFIASLFNLPSFKLNALEGSTTRANVAEQQREYLYTSLSRWLEKFVQESRAKLLTEVERQPREPEHFYKWSTAAFLRADITTRYQTYQIGVQNRWLSPNDVRVLERKPEHHARRGGRR